MAQFVVMGLPPPPYSSQVIGKYVESGACFGPTRLINDLSIELQIVDLGVFLIKTKVFGLELCFESMVLNVPGLLL
jgi:hypothetical protein